LSAQPRSIEDVRKADFMGAPSLFPDFEITGAIEMKRLFFSAAIVCVLASSASAQQPFQITEVEPGQEVAEEFATPTMTPEVWLYLQEMKKNENPKALIHRRAAHKAAQRQARLDSRKWYGQSLSRPSLNVTPFTDSYAPEWYVFPQTSRATRGVQR